MAFKIADRVRQTVTTTGTADYDLSGNADVGFLRFAEVLLEGDHTTYCCSNGIDWEIGYGKLLGTTLFRAVQRSSNGGAKVNWGAGAKSLFCVASQDTFNEVFAMLYNQELMTRKSLQFSGVMLYLDDEVSIPSGSRKLIPFDSMLYNTTGVSITLPATDIIVPQGATMVQVYVRLRWDADLNALRSAHLYRNGLVDSPIGVVWEEYLKVPDPRQEHITHPFPVEAGDTLSLDVAHSSDEARVVFWGSYFAMKVVAWEPSPIPVYLPLGTYLRTVEVTDSAEFLAALAAAQPGDHIVLRAGTYAAAHTEGSFIPTFRPTASGTGPSRSERITISGYPGETVKLDSDDGPVFGGSYHSYVVWENIEVDLNESKGAILYHTDNCIIRNCKIGNITLPTGDNCAGIQLTSATNCIVEHNYIHSIWNSGPDFVNSCGIQVYTSQNCTIRYNDILDTYNPLYVKEDDLTNYTDTLKVYRNRLQGEYGLYIDGNPHSTEVYENILIAAAGSGLLVSGDDQPLVDILVHNNVIDGAKYGIRIGNGGSAVQTGIDIWDNIIFGIVNSTDYHFCTMDDPLGTGVDYCDYNCYEPTTGDMALIGLYDPGERGRTFAEWQGEPEAPDTHGIYTSPAFVDVGNGDFRLGVGSPCLGTGRDGGDMGCFAEEYWLPNIGRNGGEI